MGPAPGGPRPGRDALTCVESRRRHNTTAEVDRSEGPSLGPLGPQGLGGKSAPTRG